MNARATRIINHAVSAYAEGCPHTTKAIKRWWVREAAPGQRQQFRTDPQYQYNIVGLMQARVIGRYEHNPPSTPSPVSKWHRKGARPKTASKPASQPQEALESPTGPRGTRHKSGGIAALLSGLLLGFGPTRGKGYDPRTAMRNRKGRRGRG